MGKPQIAVRIPPFLLEKLISYAECSGVSKTEVVISALSKYLEYTEDVPTSRKIVELEERVTRLEALARAN